MTEAPPSPPDRTAGRALDAATRQRLAALLKDELARASRDAVARGASSSALAAELNERIARLRIQITKILPDDSSTDDS